MYIFIGTDTLVMQNAVKHDRTSEKNKTAIEMQTFLLAYITAKVQQTILLADLTAEKKHSYWSISQPRYKKTFLLAYLTPEKKHSYWSISQPRYNKHSYWPTSRPQKPKRRFFSHKSMNCECQGYISICYCYSYDNCF